MSPSVHKRKKAFRRHQADRLHRIPTSWRKPRGIDNRARRRFKGQLPMPGIGYRTSKKARHVLPNGMQKIRVANARDLELLLMSNKKFQAELAHSLSSKSRVAMLARAHALGITVTNAAARLRSDE
ncbi:60S ribosomal protein L32 [Auricularia subglabra TFB-10046 SS5]|uniref:60S ribosomal protein L32 n=1 Tax=Auricularia subglabra (strain TFB-10046 / SS5) TaxID=717982 RepID=J0LF17_AURST|nr:60S ribosomal protein L32 [Auricularia subglabra TFB-10046 SS5]